MHQSRGMTLIDVVVGTALVLIIFVALFGLMRASISISSLVKSETAGMAIANSQMEYVRSLPYASVGTIGGIPAGPIPQNSTTTEDSVAYGVRTFVEYYDDPADGTGSNDTNGITADYKVIKVSVTYQAGGKLQNYSLVSDYAPPGLETTVGGGTLQVVVVNAAGTPVPGASVQITNASTSPAVNLITFTDSSGIVALPGATASTQYAITVTKAGYSTAQTYARNGTNQNPTPGYLTVATNKTTTGTFAIDALGLLTIHTYSPPTSGAFTDTFANSSKLVSLTNTTASGGVLKLSSGSTSGSALSTSTTPQSLSSWGVASSTMTVPPGTTALVHVVDGNGNLIPDSVLAGNSAGFSTFPISLATVSTSTYPTLALSANLQTTASSTSSSLTGWSITYQQSLIPLPNVSFSLTGAKTIGSTGAGAPIYKTTVSTTTDSTGTRQLSLEWDSYTFALSGYDVIDACSAPPFALSPGASVNESLTLGPATANSLLVTVTDSSGNILPGASVTLSRSGYTSTVTTTSCGDAYFGNETAGSSYSVQISKSGYTTTTVTGVSIAGDTYYADSF